jgi:type II secretory pathway pseudopilin PulG
MVLILVMAGVVAPSFSGFVPAFRVQKAADVVVATAGKAHADSVLTLRRYRLYLVTSVEEGQSPYSYLAYEEDPLREPGLFRKLPGAWGEPEELPEDVTFETLDGAQEDAEKKEKYYDFNSDGTATGGAITLANSKGDRVTITIEPTTSKVSIPEVTE